MPSRFLRIFPQMAFSDAVEWCIPNLENNIHTVFHKLTQVMLFTSCTVYTSVAIGIFYLALHTMRQLIYRNKITPVESHSVKS